MLTQRDSAVLMDGSSLDRLRMAFRNYRVVGGGWSMACIQYRVTMAVRWPSCQLCDG